MRLTAELCWPEGLFGRHPTTGGGHGWARAGQWRPPLYFSKHMLRLVKRTPVTIYA